jgi:hypothetical protein
MLIDPALANASSAMSQPMSGAHQVQSLDQMVNTGLKKLQRVLPDMYSQTVTWLGSNPTTERKKSFMKQLTSLEQALANKRVKAQQPRAISASQQGGVINLTRSKRKEPPTTVMQPISKRRHIDLTIDEVPRVRLPRREQVSERGTQAPVSLKTPGGQSISVVPVPEHIAPGALYAHALIHHVNLHEVELNDTIYHDKMAHISEHSSQHAVISRLDPTPQVLRRMKKANSEQQLPVYKAEPNIAAAVCKVKSGKFNFSWSAENEELLRPTSDEELVRIGCTRDEDGHWRAPSAESVTQERANLEWELLAQEDRVYSC